MIKIDYKIIRSARKTVSISVKDGKVLVRAPYRYSEDKIEEFVQSHINWIQKNVDKQQKKEEVFTEIKNLKNVLILGVEKRLCVGGCKNFENENELYVKNISSIRKYLENAYGYLIFESIYSLAKIIGEMPIDLKVKDYKTKWGACDKDGVISINWRILFLPLNMQRYVFIHELCHLKHFNHSKQFWQEVSRFCPDYKNIKKSMENYSFLTYIYR